MMTEQMKSKGLAHLIGLLGLAAVILLAATLPATRASVLAQQEVDGTPLSVSDSDSSTDSVTETPRPYAAPLDADDLIGNNFPITTAANRQWYPAVAWNSSANEYLVVWDDFRSNSTYDIYGQRIRADGMLLGSNIAISLAVADQRYPDVTWNATTNEYMVVWDDWRNGSSNRDVYGQRVKGNGGLLGGNLVISSATGSQGQPVMAWNATANEYLVVWNDGRNGSFDVYAQRIGGSGALIGGDIAISTATDSQGADSDRRAEGREQKR